MIRVSDIQRIVTAHYGLPIEAMTSQSRKRDYAWPRQVAMFLSSELTRHSLVRIGALFGGRDHTTVRQGLIQTQHRIETEAGFAAVLEELREKCSQHAVRVRKGAWEEDELNILRANYPNGGTAAVRKLLPYRSKEAVSKAAKKLGLKVQSRRVVNIQLPKECKSCGAPLRYANRSKYLNKPPKGLCRSCNNKLPRSREQLERTAAAIRQAYIDNPHLRLQKSSILKRALANMPEVEREKRRRSGRMVGLSGLGNLACPAGSEARKIAAIHSVATRKRKAMLAAIAERKRPKTFEEQLQAVLEGRAKVVPVVRIASNDPQMTLGGVSAGWAA